MVADHDPRRVASAGTARVAAVERDPLASFRALMPVDSDQLGGSSHQRSEGQAPRGAVIKAPPVCQVEIEVRHGQSVAGCRDGPS
jgi:hypothetical protein